MYSPILASQMHVCLHTSPANTMGFTQDQPWKVKTMISHCLHEEIKHLENMHSIPQPPICNATYQVFLPKEKNIRTSTTDKKT